MGNSVVDMGAAAVDYVSDAASDFYDYMTGSSEASASGGYYKSLGPGARQYYSGPGEDKSSSIMDYIGFEDGGAVDLGAGSPEEMEKFLEFLRTNRPVYKEGDERPYTYYSDMLMVPEEKRNTPEQEYETLPRADMYQEFPEGRRMEEFGPSEPQMAFDDGGAVEGIMSVDLSKGADTTGPDTMRPIPQYPGIEGFDIYKDLAPEQFMRRPMAKQNFDKKRGFQFGQMVELRDDAVGGKLLKQAGIMTPVDQVKQTVDPKVMDQMSRILGREVV